MPIEDGTIAEKQRKARAYATSARRRKNAVKERFHRSGCLFQLDVANIILVGHLLTERSLVAGLSVRRALDRYEAIHRLHGPSGTRCPDPELVLTHCVHGEGELADLLESVGDGFSKPASVEETQRIDYSPSVEQK